MAKRYAQGRRHKRPDAGSSSKQLKLFDKHKPLDSRKPRGTWGIRFGMPHCGCGGVYFPADPFGPKQVDVRQWLMCGSCSLSLLPQICTNGMVGYTRAFRSDVSLGKDIAHCIGRALETYDNGEGYAALRQRFESAQSSWVSVWECLQLYKSLIKVKERKDVTSDTLMCDFYRMTGNLNELYGLANLDALSSKRQRILPARCRVYHLLNFASEIATHHSTAEGEGRGRCDRCSCGGWCRRWSTEPPMMCQTSHNGQLRSSLHGRGSPN